MLREGMDLPEVTLVAILDADREGFLRSYRSLIQIMGRAARNINSRIILYADKMTDSIRKAVSETKRRREKQIAFNTEHNITPRSISKDVSDLLPPELAEAFVEEAHEGTSKTKTKKTKSQGNTSQKSLNLEELERAMWEAVEALNFERAAAIRDAISEIKSLG